jgi:transglutaminase-like putative cysteine protease
MTVKFGPVGATLDRAYFWLGVPTTDSFQSVVSASASAGVSKINTTPNNRPMYEWRLGQTTLTSDNQTESVQQSFVVKLSSVRVNPASLRKVTWQQLSSGVPSNVQNWLNPNATVQSTDSRIATFVTNSLPVNYQSHMSPYDAVRTLCRAVAKTLTYQSPAGTDGTAVGTLVAKKGDCGGFSHLLVASLRNIGIPARSLCGWWAGTNLTHCVMDFYLPGVGWIPVDPSLCNQADPTGTYAYYCGYVPNMNQFCFVCVGEDFETSYASTSQVQIGAYWVYGSGVTSTLSWSCTLK